MSTLMLVFFLLKGNMPVRGCRTFRAEYVCFIASVVCARYNCHKNMRTKVTLTDVLHGLS